MPPTGMGGPPRQKERLTTIQSLMHRPKDKGSRRRRHRQVKGSLLLLLEARKTQHPQALSPISSWHQRRSRSLQCRPACQLRLVV